MKYILLILILFATSADARMMLPIVGGGVPASGCSGTIGETGTPSTTGSISDFIICEYVQNTTGCTITSVSTISTYINSDTDTTTVENALYTDNGGAVGTFICESSPYDPSAYGTGWHDESVSCSPSIANNDYYWICMWADAGSSNNFVYGRETSGGTHAYYSYAYDGTWPATGASMSTDGTNRIFMHTDSP